MDKVLARFKIQTKVIILIFPLLLTILAIGATGLYASRLLETRIYVSNDVVQLLSGFKSVYAGIATFLRQPDDDSYKAASAITTKQIADIGDAVERLSDAQDVGELQKAQQSTQAILSDIDEIWRIRADRISLVSGISEQLDALNSVQMDLGKYAFKLVARATQDSKKKDAKLLDTLAAQSLLGAAQRFADDARALGAGWSAGPTAKDLNVSMDALARKIASADKLLKGFGIANGNDLSKRLSAFATRTRENTDPDLMADEAKLVDALSAFCAQMYDKSQAATDQVTADLKSPNGSARDVDEVNKKMRSIIGNSSEVKIAFARILGEPSEDNVKAVERALFVYQGEVDLLKNVAAIDPYFAEIPPQTKAIVDRLNEFARGLEANRVLAETQFRDATGKINDIWELMAAFADAQRQMASSERVQANSISFASMIVGLLVAVVSGAALVVTLKRPIGSITTIMRRLAGGALDIGIDGDRRRDEIGDMARALAVFKENAAQKIAMQTRTEELHKLAETERQQNEQERLSTQSNIEFAVSSLAAGLKNLADRDLRNTIDTRFSGELDTLRQDFNRAVTDLNLKMSEVRATSAEIHSNGRLLAEASGDLSRRNEQQAGSIEQAATAIEAITLSVREASQRAESAAKIVESVRQEADGSLVIVRNAVGAMARIKEASDRIETIVGVIDGIAFQTNLLALNAGVEAARAGETGKGFAVVAHEVRELAQRAALAAKEIGKLVNHATAEVGAGVGFVEEAGQALDTIANRIGDVSQHVGQMALSSRSQANSLNEINGSVSTMESMTQLNAAMAEEAGAATRRLAEQVDELMELVGSFALDETKVHEAGRAA